MPEVTLDDLKSVHHRMEKAEIRIGKVEMAQTNHEEVCSLRYQQIADKQTRNEGLLEDIRGEIKEIGNEKMRVLMWGLSTSVGLIVLLVGYIFTKLHS